MLEINNLSKKYSNEVWGILNFSLNVSKGEVVCIAGPNGSGKTTIINCVLDVLEATKGNISYDKVSSKSIKYKENVAYVPDDTLLIDALTGKEYIAFISKMYGMKESYKIEALINLFNLKSALDQAISSYSHGMKKKLQLICAFMLDAKVIVLDEPARGLDVESIIVMKKLMNKFIKSGGSILLSTHDLISAEQICDRICLIAHGKKIAEDKPYNLKIKYDAENLEEVFLKSVIVSERGKEIEKIISDF